MSSNGSGRGISDDQIIYDWNTAERTGRLAKRAFTFFDETLRDGIQSPSVKDPKIEDKLRMLELMNIMGIEYMNVGLPGAGPRAVADVTRLVQELRDRKLNIKPACAARTHVADIQPIVDISQKLGVAIEVMAFIGSSPIRSYAEGWDVDGLKQKTAEAISFAAKNNLPVTYVTEDTTRSRPETLGLLFRTAIENGAKRLCLCDTVGHVTPDGIHNLLRFTRSVIDSLGVPVGIDWHGHNDRGLAVTNAIYAVEYGADRVHGTVLGVGERVGNAAMDQILLNLRLLDELGDRDLSPLIELCNLVSRACDVPIPANYPLAGADAFRTATGVHAAAIIKAEKKGDQYLADRIYSGVPAGLFGREQEIEIGHMSGESNVVYWLTKRKIEPEAPLVASILKAAKSTDHLLTEAEVRQIIDSHRATAAP